MKSNQKNIYRRFELIDASKEEAFLKLVEEKGLTHDDLMTIMQTIKTEEGAKRNVLINTSETVKEALLKYLDAETAEKVVEAVKNGFDVIIDGEQGPTGKTTLCRELNRLGVTAEERWKMKINDSNTAYITIFLNKGVNK